jgi:hypothetical protein
MKEANDIVKELEELQSPLAGMPRGMPYIVPTAYFTMLEESVMQGVTNQPEYKLAIPQQVIPYEVPAGYFEELPGNIVALASFSIGKQQPATAYTLPEGYFDQLPMQVLAAAKQAHAPKEKNAIPLTVTLWKNLRWAAAALLILGIGFGSYTIMQPGDTATTEEQLAQIPNNTLNEYIQVHIDEFDAEMIAANVTATNTPTTPAQLEEADIINYLNETGWDETTIN